MSLATMNPDVIDRELDAHGYTVISDDELASICPAAREEYVQCLAQSEAHSPREAFHYSTLAEKPWRKLAVGSANGIGNPYAQNLQSIYFDANDKHYPALGQLFRSMLKVRNKLMRVSEDFGSDPKRDRFWNACRVHHYPRGGGFMVIHKDTHFPQVISSQLGKPFYQVCVFLSRKKQDFFDGGGFVVNNQDERIDLELKGGFGSLVVFDGRTHHGVDDIDLDQVIDFSRSDGRLAAFVNLYSVRD